MTSYAHNDINDDAYTTTYDSHIDIILHIIMMNTMTTLATLKHVFRLLRNK